MAYISVEQVAQIRKQIKNKFPAKKGWRFSITREHYTGINITIVNAPVNFLSGYKNGHSIIPSERDHPYLQQIYNIANSGNHDNSDTMLDYFDVGWYIWLKIGSWGKPFTFKTNN